MFNVIGLAVIALIFQDGGWLFSRTLSQVTNADNIAPTTQFFI